MKITLRPDLEQRLQELSVAAGRPQRDLLEEAVSAYLDEAVATARLLSTRLDEIEAGTAIAIPGAQVETHFQARRRT